MEDNKFNEQITGSRKLLVEDKFRFDCHPGVSCFTRCCKDADMYLYPYDIIRMKNRLGISSDRFLEQNTFRAIRDNPYFPSLMLKMSDDKEKSCQFLSSEGCTIYEDRPFSCRAYPLEHAVARTGEKIDAKSATSSPTTPTASAIKNLVNGQSGSGLKTSKFNYIMT